MSPLMNQQIIQVSRFEAFLHSVRCSPSLPRFRNDWKQQALLTTITLLDDRFSSLSLLMKQMLHPRCERVTRRATTQGPIRCKRGLTQNSWAGNPKRLRPNCLSTAGRLLKQRHSFVSPRSRVVVTPCGRPAGPQCAKHWLRAMLLRLFQLADGEG